MVIGTAGEDQGARQLLAMALQDKCAHGLSDDGAYNAALEFLLCGILN